MPRWQNGNLSKWQVDEMASWQNGKLTKCKLRKCQSDNMTHWQSDKVASGLKWQITNKTLHFDEFQNRVYDWWHQR